MTEALAKKTMIAENIEQVLIGGDLSKLNVDQRLSYYKAVCDSVGLNPLTKPFDYINLSGKLVLYAKRDATDQLRKIHGVSILSIESKNVSDVFVVTAHAQDRDGRQDSSTGAVNIAKLQGDALANALMKAETKAKRRVTLSICGLGLLDETEIETIPDARPMGDGETTTRPSATPRMAQRTAAKPIPVEDVICNQCSGVNRHLSDCPTMQKKTQLAQAEKIIYVLNVKSVEQKTTVPRTNDKGEKVGGGRPYTAVSCEDGNGTKMIVNIFHETPQKYAGLWVNKECEMEIEAKQQSGKTLYTLSQIHRAGNVRYENNMPIAEEVLTSADLGFDEPQE